MTFATLMGRDIILDPNNRDYLAYQTEIDIINGKGIFKGEMPCAIR